jgi:hypothetical protein
LPDGVRQFAYIFEMRTVKPVLYSDNKTYQCAYYNSSRVVSKESKHTIDTIGGESVNLNTWKGVC